MEEAFFLSQCRKVVVVVMGRLQVREYAYSRLLETELN